MNNWKKYNLSELIYCNLGKMLDKEKNKGEYLPYLGNINVRWGSFELDNLQKMRFEESENEKYELNYGDLVICEGGEPGRCAIWENQIPNMKFQKALHRVRPKKSIDNRFLYYWFLYAGKKGLLERYFTGSTIKHLPIESLLEISIRIPCLDTQKLISTFLYTIDRKIVLNNAINAELEKLAKTLYNYWFVQFDFPNAKGKPYRASGGKMEYNDVLKREIPKGWEVKRFSELATITTGKEDANFSTPKGKYNFFTCGREILRCDTPAFNGKAVLLAGNGDFNVKHYSGEFNAYQRTYVLIPKEHAHYAAMYIAANDKVAELKKGAYGSIVKFITMSDVENIALPVNEGYISLFKKLNDIIIKIELLEQENSTLVELRDFLLPLLMNGQVRVD